MAMLEVIEESRQRAMAQRDAAVEHMASAAVSALVAGEDIRRIAKACGFDLEAPPVVRTESGGSFFAISWGVKSESQVERFAQWLGEAVRNMALAKIGENGIETAVPEVPNA